MDPLQVLSLQIVAPPPPRKMKPPTRGWWARGTKRRSGMSISHRKGTWWTGSISLSPPRSGPPLQSPNQETPPGSSRNALWPRIRARFASRISKLLGFGSTPPPVAIPSMPIVSGSGKQAVAFLVPFAGKIFKVMMMRWKHDEFYRYLNQPTAANVTFTTKVPHLLYILELWNFGMARAHRRWRSYRFQNESQLSTTAWWGGESTMSLIFIYAYLNQALQTLDFLRQN